MVIEIRRRYVSVTGDATEATGLVWRYDNGAYTFGGTVPDGYAVGLLIAYVDGEPVDLAGLEAAIAASGLRDGRKGGLC